MSVKVMAWVWYQDIDPNEKLVLLAYADRAWDDGSHVFPSINDIVTKTSYTRRTVQRITRSLEQKGYLVDQGVHPTYGTNMWLIPIPQDVGGRNSDTPIDGGRNLRHGGASFGHGGGVIDDKKPAQITPEPSFKTSSKPSLKTTTNSAPPFGILLDHFLETAGIDEQLMDQRKSHKEITEKWIPADVLTEEITEAVEYMRAQDLTIAGPWSITNAIIRLRADGRKRNGPQAVYEEVFVDGELHLKKVTS